MRGVAEFSVSILTPLGAGTCHKGGWRKDVAGRRSEARQHGKPRSLPPAAARPRLPLAGLDLFMLARTVDKLRATLPGGSLGTYSKFPLQRASLGTARHCRGRDARCRCARGLRRGRRRLGSASAPTRRATRKSTQRWSNGRLAHRLGDPAFVAKYPIARSLPPDMPLLDFLSTDDADMFPPSRP